MSPLAAMAMNLFANKFPGLADLMMKFPNFKQETKDRLLAFAKLLSESADPEAVLNETLENTLNPPKKEPKRVKVIEVSEVKKR
jgi:hypothetical protein